MTDLRISEAAALLGVCTETLRRWERDGKLLPERRTEGGERRYCAYSLAVFCYPRAGTFDEQVRAARARAQFLDKADVFLDERAKTKAARND